MTYYVKLDQFHAVDPNEPKKLRHLLGQYATGVTIITTRGQDGRKIGMTANSFSSLSLDPPLILWSLSKTAPSLPDFNASQHFAIHMLAQEHHALSQHFARGAVDKFADVVHANSEEGIPLLDNALVTLICENHQQVDGGDHIIFIGKVTRFHQREGEPLVFHGGQYRAITAHPEL